MANLDITHLTATERERLLMLARSSNLKAKTAQYLPIAKAGTRLRLPVSFAQERLWFLAQTERGSETYHIPYAARLRGKLDKDALRRALNRVVERHEALRTRFVVVDGEPEQRIAGREESGFELVEEDLR
ncbi:MAG TPA: condensation domain-containing protein, partial [Candidatus Angelobacter sp.]|nr:condensation domain-containing protein [Candidatus Angelobacter sp.]